MTRGGAQDDGFALLLVLWTMSLLALLASQVTGGGRAETRIAAALTLQARLEAAADAGVQETIWHLLAGTGPRWLPEDGDRVLPEGGIPVAVSIEDDRGKLDLNEIPPDLIATFFAVLGSGRDDAHALSDTLVEWRTGQLAEGAHPIGKSRLTAGWGPPRRDLERLDELLLVPGMTGPLYRAALPHLVLHLQQGPLRRSADPVVRAALDRNRLETKVTEADQDPRGPVVLTVVARATTEAGGAFTRRAQVRLTGTMGSDHAHWRILSWTDGETKN